MSTTALMLSLDSVACSGGSGNGIPLSVDKWGQYTQIPFSLRPARRKPDELWVVLDICTLGNVAK